MTGSRFVLALALAAHTSLAVAAPYEVKLDARQCKALPDAAIAKLWPAWSALAAFVQRCPVAGPDGRLILTVDVIRFDHAAFVHAFDGHQDLRVPVPMLRDAAGQAVGSLPEGFPVDPPGKLRVTFADWRDGMPRTIRLYEAGVSALQPHAVPPLLWHAETRMYQRPQIMTADPKQQSDAKGNGLRDQRP